MMQPLPLHGRTIAIAEARELDLFAALLERRGATVLRYPLVRIVDAADPAPVLAWLDGFSAGACDDLILLTGEGLRRLLGCIHTHQPAQRAAFLAALAAVRKITRGPKPARVLRELGLKPDIEAPVPTTAGIIATLQPLPLGGRHVGVQLYGEDSNPALMQFLQAAGAHALPVAPYAYVDASDDQRVQELLQQMIDGRIDAIALTSQLQVERLFRAGPAERVRAALAVTPVAAIGPLVAAALAAHGVPARAMPEQSWFLKPLTAELVELLAKTK